MSKSFFSRLNEPGLVLLLVGIIAASGLPFSPFASHAEAATYYVATNGNDANPGTDSSPFRTIRKGLSVLTAGNTLFIKGGTYTETINSNAMRIPAGTSWSVPVTIAAYPGHVVVVRPGAGGEVVNLAHSYIQYLIIDRIIVDATSANFGVSLTNGARNVRFQNGEVRNAGMSGILLTNGSGATQFNHFVNMKLHSNGKSRLDHGIYISASNNVIERSDVFGNSGYGIHVYNSYSGQRSSNNIVRSNRTYKNGSFGIILSSGDRNLAYNNLVWGNRTGGIEVQWKTPTNAGVFNNTIYANTGNGIEVGADSSGATVRNNIVYQNSGTIGNRGSSTQISNNLMTDPKFVNVSGSDFSVQLGSSALNGGMKLVEVTTDFNGVPRPQGTAYDIGAFEFRGSTTTSSTSSSTASSPSAPTAPTDLQVQVQ